MKTTQMRSLPDAIATTVANPRIPFRRKWLPPMLIAAPWPVMLFLYYYGPISFRLLAIETWLYLSAMLAMLILGYQAGWITSRQNKVTAPTRTLLSPGGFRALVLISSIGSVILLADSLRSGYSFYLLLNDPVQGRVLQAAHVTSMLTTVSFPFSVLSYSAFLFSITRWAQGERSGWTILGMLSVLPALLANALQAGRQTFLITGLLLLSWFVLYFGHKTVREMLAIITRRIHLIIPIAGLVLVYFFFIAARRHSGTALTLDMWFRIGGLSARSADVVTGGVSDEILIGGYSGIYYYTHQLSALDSIITGHVSAEGFGRGVLGWVLLQFSRTGIDLTYDDLPVQMAMLVRGENMSGWATGLATLISDFGQLGSMLFMFLASMVLARFVRSAYERRTDVDVIAAAWLMAASIFMIQFFPRDGVFTMNIALLVVLRLRQSSGRKTRVDRSFSHSSRPWAHH